MIKSCLADVRSRIARAAEAASRDPASVKLVCVSKTRPVSAIREAYDAGQRAFGENYAQELAAKADELLELPEIEWHFIGHLQTNKAKLVVPRASIVHTVDAVPLVLELSKRTTKADRVLPVLIEVNVGREPQKHGVAPADLAELLDAVEAAKGLELRGLMTMPPNDLEQARRAFEALASLRKLHGGKARLPELSMGMSDDLEIAIAAGATMVRVGTAIFGKR